MTMPVLLLAVGCVVAFPSRDPVEDSRTFAATPDWKPSIALVIAGTAHDSGESERPMVRGELERSIEEIVTAYEESGLFSAVKPGLDEADLRAEIHLSGRTDDPSALWSLLSVLSAGSIPTPGPTQHYAMTTTFRSRTADALSTIHRENTVTSWVGWVFLPVSPFYFPPSVYRETKQQLVLATLWAARDVLYRSGATPIQD